MAQDCDTTRNLDKVSRRMRPVAQETRPEQSRDHTGPIRALGPNSDDPEPEQDS